MERNEPGVGRVVIATRLFWPRSADGDSDLMAGRFRRQKEVICLGRRNKDQRVHRTTPAFSFR